MILESQEKAMMLHDDMAYLRCLSVFGVAGRKEPSKEKPRVDKQGKGVRQHDHTDRGCT